MLKATLLSMLMLPFLFPVQISQSTSEIEIFDINEGEVIQTVPTYLNVQDEVMSYLDNITGVYKKVNPIPKNGMMVKIPLEPAYLLENAWLSSFIDEVILIFTKNEEPILLLFDDENSPHFFHFKGDTFTLLEQINVVKRGINMER